MATANFVTDITEIITQAAEAAAGIGSILAGFKNVELARKYYDLYAEQRNFYYDVFHNGVEAPLINELYTIPVYARQYATRVATLYNGVTGPFGGQSGDILGWWTRHANMYGAAVDAQITELDTDQARLQSDWTNYLFRFEELWADVRNDTRWTRRLAAHNLGIKQGSAVSATLNSSLTEFQGHISDMASQLATYGNGIARYAGYKRGMADTVDDFNSGAAYERARVLEGSHLRMPSETMPLREYSARQDMGVLA